MSDGCDICGSHKRLLCDSCARDWEALCKSYRAAASEVAKELRAIGLTMGDGEAMALDSLADRLEGSVPAKIQS